MKKQVIFIWGWVAKENYRGYYEFLEKFEFNPYEKEFQNWNKSLGDFLWDEYEYIRIPLPEKGFADYTAWKIIFEKVFLYLRENPIIVAWSLWATFLLKYMTENSFPVCIEKTFLLAAALNDSLEEKLGTFSFPLWEISKLEPRLGQIYIYHSQDDKIVAFSDGEYLANQFEKKVFRIFSDKWHFYQLERFPEIEDDIKNN